MRIISDRPDLIATLLSGFLQNLATSSENDCRPFFANADLPLVCPDGESIKLLSSSPAIQLQKAWFKLIDNAAVCRLLPEIPDKQITITPTLTALAIVAYNFSKISSCKGLNTTALPAEFSGLNYNLQLCRSIPAAAPISAVIYDKLIDCGCRIRRKNPPADISEKRFLTALLALNPLSELKNLDLALPAALSRLTKSYLPQGQNIKESSVQGENRLNDDGNGDGNCEQWWIQAENLLSNLSLKRLLRDQWLILPENSLSCTGLGIFLEELRRRGEEKFRTTILEFFEAYDYMHCQQRPETAGNDAAHPLGYPRLTIIKHLLESKNRQLNRRGNEYFLKFRALLEIIAREQSIPREFRHLSREFCLQHLAPLTALATVVGGDREMRTPTFGKIQFSDRPRT
ncbi:MAG: hypothetical protein JXR80_00375 [Deltaproteobacteria bacterium]|nr:hypothetical protein [Deltaproteobacteria bacterium]